MRMRGFTLIELLVVIVIIAILAAFLFPVYNKVMAEGAKRACTANLHQIAVALGQYYQDHHAYPPSPWDGAAYNSYGGLVALTKSNLSLPMLCKEDERAASDFVDGVAFSYAYDFEGRNPNVPADIQDRRLPSGATRRRATRQLGRSTTMSLSPGGRSRRQSGSGPSSRSSSTPRRPRPPSSPTAPSIAWVTTSWFCAWTAA